MHSEALDHAIFYTGLNVNFTESQVDASLSLPPLSSSPSTHRAHFSGLQFVWKGADTPKLSMALNTGGETQSKKAANKAWAKWCKVSLDKLLGLSGEHELLWREQRVVGTSRISCLPTTGPGAHSPVLPLDIKDRPSKTQERRRTKMGHPGPRHSNKCFA